MSPLRFYALRRSTQPVYLLELGTVDSFDKLKHIFLNHFMIQTDRFYSADDSYTIRNTLLDLAMNTHGVQRLMIWQPSTPSKVAFGHLIYGTTIIGIRTMN